MQQTIQFSVSPTQKLWGVIYTPDDLNTNTEKCALFMSCHGVGETGLTQADAAKVIGYSPLAFTKDYDPLNGSAFKFTSPADNKETRFILVALQHPTWSPSPDQLKYCIQNDLFTRFPNKIDTNAIFIGGLSAGGDVTLQSISTNGILELYAAAVPMSPASKGNISNIQATANAKIETWGFSGVNDGGFTNNLKQWNVALNAKAANTARETIYPGGHQDWNKFFNPAYREDHGGVMLNIYEWCLANKKGSTWINPPKNYIVSAEFDYTYADGTIILDGSKSNFATPEWNGYRWDVEPYPGGNWNFLFVNEPPDYTIDPYGKKNKIISAFGVYKVKLTVTDVYGVTATKTKDVIPTDAPPPDPGPKKVFEFIFQETTITGYDNKTWK